MLDGDLGSRLGTRQLRGRERACAGRDGSVGVVLHEHTSAELPGQNCSSHFLRSIDGQISQLDMARLEHCIGCQARVEEPTFLTTRDGGRGNSPVRPHEAVAEGESIGLRGAGRSRMESTLGRSVVALQRI